MGLIRIVCAVFLTSVLNDALPNIALGKSMVPEQGQYCKLFNQYYDHGTELCEPCRDICDDAAAKRTESQCQDHCSDYLTSLNCRHGEYFDDQVRRCSSCSEICENHSVRGTTEECSSKCPSFSDSLSKDRNETESPQPSRKEPQGKTATTSSEFLPSYILGLTVLIVVTIGGITAILIAVFIKRRQLCVRNIVYAEAPQRDGENDIKRGQQEEVGLQETPKYPLVETQPGQNSELVLPRSTGT